MLYPSPPTHGGQQGIFRHLNNWKQMKDNGIFIPTRFINSLPNTRKDADAIWAQLRLRLS